MRLTAVHAQQLTGDADRWLEPLNDALIRWEISTPERVAMFLAQCAHESGGFKHLVENLHYSAASLLALWPHRFTADEAVHMAYNEEAIAERAYGGRMGNGPEGSGDGYRYRGRGIIQLTGRDNYRRCGQALGTDFETMPEAVQREKWAAQSAGWFWATNGCNALADAGDYEAITRRINGGLNGYADRQAWLSKVRGILGEPTTQPAAPIEDKSTEYAPVGAPTGDAMGPSFMLLSSILPSVLQLFSGAAQAKIAKATGDPEAARVFMQSLAANVGGAVGIPVTDNATAMQAVGKFTEAPTPAAVQALETKALATVDELIRLADKSIVLDQTMWSAQNEGRRGASTVAIEEKKAGLWDMTRTLVYFSCAMMAGLGAALVGALLSQALTAERTIDSGLLGLSGPILMAIVTAFAAIIAYRFDGTKASSEQGKALTDAIRERGAK